MIDAAHDSVSATHTASAAPRDEYVRRRDDFDRQTRELRVADRQLSLWRAVLFAAGVGMVALAVQWPGASWWWCLIPAAAFVVAVIQHEGVSRRLERCRRGIAHHDDNVKRMDHRWIEVGVTGDRYIDERHPYDTDLDLFGKGSLFHWLCRARTRLGEDTLAEWLRAAATPSVIDFRQRAINELRPRVDLRENLALLPAEVHDSLDQTLLRSWAAQPPHDVPRRWLVVAAILGLTALVSGFGWLAFGWHLAVLAGVAIAELLLHFALRDLLHRVAHDIDRADSGWPILSQELGVLEAERFQTPLLTALRSQLDTAGRPPSAQIRRLQRLSAWLDSSLHNQFFAPLAFLLCLPIWLIHFIERWRENVGPHIEQWLDAVGQFEAISSLASYAYEHPTDPFPEIVSGQKYTDRNTPNAPRDSVASIEPLFDAIGLGHPLIRDDRCVRNDVRFGREPQLVMVSGSNMSGKSTLLRTIGSNVVLALAGAPVRATRLRLSPLMLATAMRVHDSLLEGSSLFYAVISRLKGLVERTGGSVPLLFLIDEILPGTNSHDRRVGAEAIIRRLLDRGAVGLVTTHDLALTDIVAQLAAKAINVHFEDRLEAGTMTFDYLLRPGVVRRSNALELMRLVGLGDMPTDKSST